MSGRFVRSSKYRHVFGKASKPEQCYQELKVSKSAWDTDKVTVNTKYLSFIWEAGGGGSFAVLRHDQTGKLGSIPLIAGHKNPVLDIEFHKFNQNLIASASEDATAKIWQVPEDGLTENIVDAAQTLSGHRRKVGQVKFNPVANNILATSSTDYTVKLWDIESSDCQLTVEGHANIIQSMCWNRNGSLLTTSSKDAKLRILDPRGNSIAQTWDGHKGVKGSRALWLGNKEWIFSCGFSRSSEREMSIWDPKNTSKALASISLDTSSGMLMPFYDADTSMIYLAGKGDGNIRYYEITDEGKYLYPLSEFKSNSPQRGMGMAPKVACDIASCEVAKLYKVQANAIEPISMTVPRKSDLFQDDIFPDTQGLTPALDAKAWLGGENKDPILVSLEGGFKASGAAEQTFTKTESLADVKAENEKLKNRIAFLEAELAKK